MVRTVDLIKELVLPFASNRVLVEGLAKSEVQSFKPQEHLVWCVKSESGDVVKFGDDDDWFTAPEEKIRGKIDQLEYSPKVGIPGGMIGKHAFYLILENFWRNLIKHKRTAIEENFINGGKKIRIFIELKDDSSNPFLWDLQLWSNVHNEVKDKEKIQDVLNEGIIDQSGELIPRGWGTKEMYTAAAHLRGLPISRLLNIQSTSVNEEDQPVLGIGHRSDHLVYTFRLLKPLQLQIIASESEVFGGNAASDERDDSASGYVFNKKDLVSRGIYLRSSLPPEQVVPTEYLVGPREEMDKVRESLLPLKRFDEPIAIHALNNDKTHYEQLIKLESRFASKMYGEDVKPHFVIRGDEEAVELIDHLGSAEKFTSCNFILDIEKKLKGGRFCIIFDRHGDKKKDIIGDKNDKNVEGLWHKYRERIFWEPYGGGTHTAFTLQHLPSGSEKQTHLGWSLVSSALLKVVILDERIQQSLTNRTWRYGKGPEIDCLRCLKSMRIFIPSRGDIENEANQEKDVLPSFDLEGPTAVDGESGGLKTKIESYIDSVKPHIVSVHAGILDKMGKKEPDDVKEYIQKLTCKCSDNVGRVIIHSGRGIPPNVPELEVPFVGYTSVEHWLTSKDLKSKHGLVRELLSARGMKR